MELGEGAAGDAMDELDEAQEAKLTVGVPDPVVQDGVDGDRRAQPQFLHSSSHHFFSFKISKN